MQSFTYTIDLETYNREQIKSKTVNLPDGRKYTILNYIFGETIDDDSGKYRSVVLNESDKIVCFAPPKSMPLDTFQNNYSIQDSSIIVNEVIEGTMINLFFDKQQNRWEITTKASIGGNSWYFRNQYIVSEKTMSKSELTFRQMFLNGLGMSESDDLQNSSILETFDRNYCYSLIIQHPMNHIVHNIIAPTIYLVAVYGINENNIIVIHPNEYESWSHITNSPIRFPRRYNESTYGDIYSQRCSVDSTYDIPGVMFYNTVTGERACMENESYKKVRELRGNQPNLQYQWLILRSEGKLSEFLLYFNQYTELFDLFNKYYEYFVKNVHDGYVTYYVKKSGIKISKQYFPIIYRIHHEVFLPSKTMDSMLIIKKEVVAEFLTKLDPKMMIYYLNWNEKQNIL